MTQPQRIQLSRAKGWRMPANTLKVDRTTPWGNPFRVGKPPDRKLLDAWLWKLSPHSLTACMDNAEALQRFRICIAFDEASAFAAVNELRGKNLACWCKPGEPCHADVLLEIANR